MRMWCPRSPEAAALNLSSGHWDCSHRHAVQRNRYQSISVKPFRKICLAYPKSLSIFSPLRTRLFRFSVGDPFCTGPSEDCSSSTSANRSLSRILPKLPLESLACSCWLCAFLDASMDRCVTPSSSSSIDSRGGGSLNESSSSGSVTLIDSLGGVGSNSSSDSSLLDFPLISAKESAPPGDECLLEIGASTTCAHQYVKREQETVATST